MFQVNEVYSFFRPYPESLKLILTDFMHVVVFQANGVGLGIIMNELIAIIPSYSIISSYPDISLSVFVNIIDEVMG